VTGLANWFGLLNRPLLSILERVYAFEAADGGATQRVLPRRAKRELLMLAALISLAEVDLTMPYHPGILATGASPSYGYGVCAAYTTAEKARKFWCPVCNQRRAGLL